MDGFLIVLAVFFYKFVLIPYLAKLDETARKKDIIWEEELRRRYRANNLDSDS